MQERNLWIEGHFPIETIVRVELRDRRVKVVLLSKIVVDE
jgi:hypothetical protein